MAFLAENQQWYKIIQDEVDGVVKKYRQNTDQSAADVLALIPIEAWENELPMIDLALRETIRFILVGVVFRRNISGKDVPIGHTGEVVPSESFAVSFIISGIAIFMTSNSSPLTFSSRYTS